ncbi:ABC transporter F family member 1 [Dichanthelium oligosanthes]|uniref:rRNA N-glycosylase n=1 Tax=Dichanthelium oligosanthes TaxID=888268 RepID=A0A1E5WNI6_9POAL|nr:ABC transporter F family member 1 [Dichanthelium oligosanthes]
MEEVLQRLREILKDNRPRLTVAGHSYLAPKVAQPGSPPGRWIKVHLAAGDHRTTLAFGDGDIYLLAFANITRHWNCFPGYETLFPGGTRLPFEENYQSLAGGIKIWLTSLWAKMLPKELIALVGPNGAGKSTLLKLMTGELAPLDGMVRRHNHLRIARFHQHLAEKLDLDMSALQYMMKEYPGNKEERMRAAVGKFGLSGKAQVMPMRNLSDGQRSRVIFAWLAYGQPQLQLLDEPTNHLDIETIDSLAEGLNEWDGGLVLVSHNFRMINQVALMRSGCVRTRR